MVDSAGTVRRKSLSQAARSARTGGEWRVELELQVRTSTWYKHPEGGTIQRTIELRDQQVEELERLAAEERRSVEELLEFAVSDYLARHQRDWSEWGNRFDALVARIQARMPADVTPEEIEADITANFEHYRAEQAAARAASTDEADADRR